MHGVRVEVRRACFLDARNLGVGCGPGEVVGAGPDGFGVACSAGACGVRSGVFEQEDVAMVSAVGDGREAARGVGNGSTEFAEGFLSCSRRL